MWYIFELSIKCQKISLIFKIIEKRSHGRILLPCRSFKADKLWTDRLITNYCLFRRTTSSLTDLTVLWHSPGSSLEHQCSLDWSESASVLHPGLVVVVSSVLRQVKLAAFDLSVAFIGSDLVSKWSNFPTTVDCIHGSFPL